MDVNNDKLFSEEHSKQVEDQLNEVVDTVNLLKSELQIGIHMSIDEVEVQINNLHNKVTQSFAESLMIMGKDVPISRPIEKMDPKQIKKMQADALKKQMKEAKEKQIKEAKEAKELKIREAKEAKEAQANKPKSKRGRKNKVKEQPEEQDQEQDQELDVQQDVDQEQIADLQQKQQQLVQQAKKFMISKEDHDMGDDTGNKYRMQDPLPQVQSPSFTDNDQQKFGNNSQDQDDADDEERKKKEATKARALQIQEIMRKRKANLAKEQEPVIRKDSIKSDKTDESQEQQPDVDKQNFGDFS